MRTAAEIARETLGWNPERSHFFPMPALADRTAFIQQVIDKALEERYSIEEYNGQFMVVDRDPREYDRFDTREEAEACIRALKGTPKWKL